MRMRMRRSWQTRHFPQLKVKGMHHEYSGASEQRLGEVMAMEMKVTGMSERQNRPYRLQEQN